MQRPLISSFSRFPAIWRFVQQEAHQLVGGQVKIRTTKIRPKAVGGGTFGRYSNVGKCRTERCGDVTSSLAVD